MTRARTDALLAAVVTLAVLFGLAGCGASGPAALLVDDDAEAAVAEARARGEAERARLGARLDALGRRLVDGQARVQAWADLRERQRQVAAVARDDGWRVADMLRAREEERLLVRAIRSPRLAAAGRPATGTGVP